MHRRYIQLLAILEIRDQLVQRLGLDRLDRRRIPKHEITPYNKAATEYLNTHRLWFYQIVRKSGIRDVPTDDVMQAIWIGGMTALDLFDSQRARDKTVTSFLSYAKWQILCEIDKLRESEMLVRVPASARKICAKIQKYADKSDDEIAALTGLSVRRVRSHRDITTTDQHVPLD